MMKFRKKTMATLFAAILIAMMGVMPALAYESTTLTVTTLAVLPSITVDVEAIQFTGTVGTIVPGGPIVITVSGGEGYPYDLSADITGDESVFVAGLTLSVDAWTTTISYVENGVLLTEISAAGTTSADLKMVMPAYTGADYTGTLVFWLG